MNIIDETLLNIKEIKNIFDYTQFMSTSCLHFVLKNNKSGINFKVIWNDVKINRANPKLLFTRHSIALQATVVHNSI